MTKLEKVLYTARARTSGGRLNVNLLGIDRQVAESLAETAHHLRAHSNATRGNIEVGLNFATGGQPMEAAYV
jgi:organic hydroperoxide reductase OsmC/OhrA